MTQQEIDAMAEALRLQGLTWAQTNFAVSLARNAIAAERERWIGICKEHAADTDPPHKPHEENYGDGWLDACNEIMWAGEERSRSNSTPPEE